MGWRSVTWPAAGATSSAARALSVGVASASLAPQTVRLPVCGLWPRPQPLAERAARIVRLRCMVPPTYTETDAVEAYLFQCDDNGLYAVSIDPEGRNIPRGPCAAGWRLQTAFALGVHEPVPAAIPPEPILRGVRAVGYYIWREGLTHGTGQ